MTQWKRIKQKKIHADPYDSSTLPKKNEYMLIKEIKYLLKNKQKLSIDFFITTTFIFYRN